MRYGMPKAQLACILGAVGWQHAMHQRAEDALWDAYDPTCLHLGGSRLATCNP